MTGLLGMMELEVTGLGCEKLGEVARRAKQAESREPTKAVLGVEELAS